MFSKIKDLFLVLLLVSSFSIFSDGHGPESLADASTQADMPINGRSIASFQKEVRQANRFFRAILEVCSARDLARVTAQRRRETLDFLLKIQNYVPGTSATFDTFWQFAQEEYNSHLAAFYAKMGRIVSGSDHEELDRRQVAVIFVKAFFDSLFEYDGPKPKNFNRICARVRGSLKEILWIDIASVFYWKQLLMKNAAAIKFGIVCSGAAIAFLVYLGFQKQGVGGQAKALLEKLDKRVDEFEGVLPEAKALLKDLRVLVADIKGVGPQVVGLLVKMNTFADQANLLAREAILLSDRLQGPIVRDESGAIVPGAQRNITEGEIAQIMVKLERLAKVAEDATKPGGAFDLQVPTEGLLSALFGQPFYSEDGARVVLRDGTGGLGRFMESLPGVARAAADQATRPGSALDLQRAIAPFAEPILARLLGPLNADGTRREAEGEIGQLNAALASIRAQVEGRGDHAESRIADVVRRLQMVLRQVNHGTGIGFKLESADVVVAAAEEAERRRKVAAAEEAERRRMAAAAPKGKA